MGLFGKKKQEYPPLFSAQETPVVNFNSVIEYLEGLSKADYDKLLKVVNIYRSANKDVNKVLGLKDEPSTAIAKESREEAELDDDSDIADLLEDIPLEDKKAAKKIKVNKG